MEIGDRVILIKSTVWTEKCNMTVGSIYTVEEIHRSFQAIKYKGYLHSMSHFELVTKSENFKTLYEKLSG